MLLKFKFIWSWAFCLLVFSYITENGLLFSLFAVFTLAEIIIFLPVIDAVLKIEKLQQTKQTIAINRLCDQADKYQDKWYPTLISWIQTFFRISLTAYLLILGFYPEIHLSLILK